MSFMTFQAKAVLSHLKTLAGNSEVEISYTSDSTCFCLFDDTTRLYDYQRYQYEIGSIINLLADEGYVAFTRGNCYQFCLTQKAIRKKQFSLSKAGAYLSDKCVDILALIIAILALLNSYGYDVLRPLIIFCMKLLKIE